MKKYGLFCVMLICLFALIQPVLAAEWVQDLKVGTLAVNGEQATKDGVGAATTITGMTVRDVGAGALHKTVFTFTNMAVAMTDEAGVIAYKGTKLYDMPAGYVYFLGGSADINLTKSSAGVIDAWDGDVGVGTVTAGNNNALATTEQNIIPTTATPQAVAGVTTADMVSTGTEHAIVDGHSTALDIFLNFLVDDTDHDVTTTACNLIVNGTLTVYWVNLGDN